MIYIQTKSLQLINAIFRAATICVTLHVCALARAQLKFQMNNIFFTWNDKNVYKIDLVLCVRVINSERRTHARNPTEEIDKTHSIGLLSRVCFPNGVDDGCWCFTTKKWPMRTGEDSRWINPLSVLENPRISVTHSVLRTLHAGNSFGFRSPTGRG